MDRSSWLADFLFPRVRATEPDGRPLYAYRCSEKKYNELTELVRQGILTAQKRDHVSYNFPALFCLYAAETFHREHTEGIWSWDTVFKPLAIDESYYTKVREWVEQGLKIWKRPLIRYQAGKNAFLITIACEGGLPLNLLHKQNAKLTQFFRLVLEYYHAQRFGGVNVAEEIATQYSHLLPSSLRQEVVFRLAGELINQVTVLQQKVGDAIDPVAALDRLETEWRKQLPLNLDDNAAKALLDGLVRHSGELIKKATTRVLWKGYLQQSLQDWQVSKVLDFPEKLSNEQVISLLASTESLPVPRFRMVLQTPEGSDTVALLTLHRQHEYTFYRREWLHRAGCVRLDGHRVSQHHKISLSAADTSYVVYIHNDEPWGDLPWVFTGGEKTGKWEWLTEGSAKTKQEVALVAVTDDFFPSRVNGGEILILGTIPSVGRTLYRVTGEAKFLSSAGDNYIICCKADTDFDESYRFHGKTITEVLNERPVFFGLPSIMASTPTGRTYQPKGKVQWRPLYETGIWYMGEMERRGRVWLRFIDESGAERIRRQVDIVPRSFLITRTVGTNLTSGSYRFQGVSHIHVLAPTEPIVETQLMGTVIQLSCPSIQDTSFEPIRLRLSWPRTEAFEILLPYPQRGAVFMFEGRVLPAHSVVPLGRLGGLQLFIQDQIDSGIFTLDVNLKGSSLGFKQKLPLLQNGSLQFLLDSERDRIISLLASTHIRDISVQIQIISGGQCLATVNVARFDVEMQPDREQSCVSINTESLQRLGDGWQSRIYLEMIPLWNPNHEPILLTKVEGPHSIWNIPTDLPPGPWWIIGRDGNWARFRPLLWTVRNLEEETVTPTEEGSLPLEVIIKTADADQRKQHLNNLIQALGNNPKHPDWELITAYIGLSSEFPPSTLDILNHLINHPTALILLLLKSNEDDFNKVWPLSEQMPFSWSLIPAKTWANVTHLYYDTLRSSLAAFERGEQMVVGLFNEFYKRMAENRPSWLPLGDWLQESLFPKAPIKGNSLLWEARLKSVDQLQEMIRLQEEDLQRRHDADEQWPTSNEVMKLVYKLEENRSYQHLSYVFRSVRCAPFVAAYICLNEIEPPPLLVYELRLIRAFDSKWFFGAYSIALAIGLAKFQENF
ncbi:STY4851/ECs_5259 family protein [Thiofilum flexile]|uniref:STY4851/ECs_5259 family protein n=1 Tax=Thiofilum flexile TaxID=125627 RepID=UPI00036048CA|nr:STY4851/ECs_5259 family protein [Thiofilum flexile]